MSVTVVSGVVEMDSTIPAVRKVMEGFSYTPHNRYLAFVKGDKVAEYGLTALVVGGAAAAASKSGLLKWVWKLLLVAIVVVGGLIKKLFSSRKQDAVQDSS